MNDIDFLKSQIEKRDNDIKMLEDELQFLTDTLLADRKGKIVCERRELLEHCQQVEADCEKEKQRALDTCREYDQKLNVLATMLTDAKQQMGNKSLSHIQTSDNDNHNNQTENELKQKYNSKLVEAKEYYESEFKKLRTKNNIYFVIAIISVLIAIKEMV